MTVEIVVRFMHPVAVGQTAEVRAWQRSTRPRFTKCPPSLCKARASLRGPPPSLWKCRIRPAALHLIQRQTILANRKSERAERRSKLRTRHAHPIRRMRPTNAALRSIVRRDTGESYADFLTKLAKASGIETPQRSDLAKLDRSRPKKGSNDEWQHPHDADARITKMKDGRTHLAHKAEHAVDMDTGAVVAVTMQKADAGDTQTLMDTLSQTLQNVNGQPGVTEPVAEVVADKGYHSNETTSALREAGVRSYLSEPERGRRNWQGKPFEQASVYANRRRIRGVRGKRLLRRRGELVERPFAHCYETGGMRRTHLRGHENILKRVLVHVAGCNLGLLMRHRYHYGTPRGLSERLSWLFGSFSWFVHGLLSFCQQFAAQYHPVCSPAEYPGLLQVA